MAFSKEEYIEWKNNKVTREYINGLKTERFNLQEEMAEGRTVGIETDRAIGQCQGIRWAVEFAVDGMKVLITDIGEQDA